MPTIGKLINKVKLLCPNKFSDQDIIDIIYDAELQVFREMQEDGVREFYTVKDSPLYPLQDGIRIEFIQEPILISPDEEVTPDTVFDEYYYARPGEKLVGKRYFDSAGLLGIYPVPTKSGLMGKIFYKKCPLKMSIDNLNYVPELREDWHSILVYACIMEIAGAGDNPDIDVVNNYTRKYNAMLQDILLYKYGKQAKFPVTKDTMKRGRFSQNYSRSSAIKTPYN